MLTPEAMLTLAAELTDAAAEGDAESLGHCASGLQAQELPDAEHAGPI